MWFSNLCPRMMVEKIEEIDLNYLKERGFKYLIVDLDNTLCSWKRGRLPREVSGWINQAIDLGFSLCLLSNSLLKWKVKRMGREIGIPAINSAGKPRKGGFLKALKLLQAKPSQTVVIGDQVFTDIWGGNRLGLFTILVKPVDKREFFTTFFQRNFEKLLLWRWKKLGILKPVSENKKKFFKVLEEGE